MRRSPFDVFLVFLRVGLSSFGGPVAHLAYFRNEFVARRAWLDDRTFGECIALSQLLPGPASSQTGMLIGWIAAGPVGMLAAWLGFTTPSAIAMTAIALALPRTTIGGGWLHGLLLVATAVVANAVATMRTSLAPDARRIALAVAVFALVLFVPLPAITPLAMLMSALAGTALLGERVPAAYPHLDLGVSRRVGIVALTLFVVMLIAFGAVAHVSASPLIVVADALFRVGSLVFGGGHVVLPLLQQQLAAAHIVSAQTILAGYGAAQAMPGPLFTLASFVGASAYDGRLGPLGACVATIA